MLHTIFKELVVFLAAPLLSFISNLKKDPVRIILNEIKKGLKK